MALVSRRHILQAVATVAFAAPLLEACGGTSATPASPAAANKSVATAAGAGAPSSSLTSSATTAPAKGKVTLSITVRPEPIFTWQRRFAQKWATQHPDVKLDMVEIPFGSMAQKQLVELASGTMQDVVYSALKWMDFTASKGGFLPIDSYVKQKDPGLKDFPEAVIANCSLDGKLYGLPYTFNTGNTNIIYYNQDILVKKGVKTPTDNWTIDEFLLTIEKTTDEKNRIWGTDLFPGTYYDFDTWDRTFGGEVLASDGKSFQLSSDKKSVETAQWFYDLRTKHHVSPSRAQSQGIAFPAGQVAVHTDGLYSIGSMRQTVGKRFKWGVVLAPKSPNGLRGYETFTTLFSIYSKSKHPARAYDLITWMTSKEAALWAFVNQGEPPARTSVLLSPEAKKDNPIWSRTANWLQNPKDKGPFPMPANLRFTELENKWEGIGPALWYGEIAFATGMQQLQHACDSVMKLPR